MGPEPIFVPRFAAEPQQAARPSGRWAHKLREEFYAACLAIDAPEGEIGEPGELTFYPDRTYVGRTYVPISAPTSTDQELYGYVCFISDDEEDPRDFISWADYTAETASANPEWTIDLCDEVIASWRAEGDDVLAIALVWGQPMVAGATVATAQLGDVVVDQCALDGQCFTLIAPDGHGDETLEILLFDADAGELARESLYDDDGEDEAGDE